MPKFQRILTLAMIGIAVGWIIARPSFAESGKQAEPAKALPVQGARALLNQPLPTHFSAIAKAVESGRWEEARQGVAKISDVLRETEQALGNNIVKGLIGSIAGRNRQMARNFLRRVMVQSARVYLMQHASLGAAATKAKRTELIRLVYQEFLAIDEFLQKGHVRQAELSSQLRRVFSYSFEAAGSAESFDRAVQQILRHFEELQYVL